MKKRLLSLVLTLAMVLSFFPGMTITANADTSEAEWYIGEEEPNIGITEPTDKGTLQEAFDAVNKAENDGDGKVAYIRLLRGIEWTGGNNSSASSDVTAFTYNGSNLSNTQVVLDLNNKSISVTYSDYNKKFYAISFKNVKTPFTVKNGTINCDPGITKAFVITVSANSDVAFEKVNITLTDSGSQPNTVVQIENAQNATFSNCKITASSTEGLGSEGEYNGIYSKAQAPLSVNKCVIDLNGGKAQRGIYSKGELTVSGTQISIDSLCDIMNEGYGIRYDNSGAAMTVTGTQIVMNYENACIGPDEIWGIRAESSGAVTISNSTVTVNAPDAYRGNYYGVNVSENTLTTDASTNIALTVGPNGCRGYGVYAGGTQANINGSTISANGNGEGTSPAYGAYGIYNGTQLYLSGSANISGDTAGVLLTNTSKKFYAHDGNGNAYTGNSAIVVGFSYEIGKGSVAVYGVNSGEEDHFALTPDLVAQFFVLKPNGEADKNDLVLAKNTVAIEEADVTFTLSQECTENGCTDENHVYNGKEHKYDVSVVVNGDTLVENTGYKVTYVNNKNAGDANAASVTIAGIEDNGYTGTVTKNFTINRKALSDGEIDAAVEYVKKNGSTYSLVGDSLKYYDVSLTYETNIVPGDDGTATVTFTLTGGYEGSKVVSNVPVKIVLNEAMFTIEQKTYTGSELEPEVTTNAYEGDQPDADDFYATFDRSKITNIGDVTVTITAQGDKFIGSITKTFTIVPKTLDPDKITVEGVADQDYTGSAIELTELVVKYDGVEMNKENDYTVSYANNTDVSEAGATVTIDFSNNFTCENVVKTFKILPIDLVVDGALISGVVTDFAIVDDVPQGEIEYNEVPLNEGAFAITEHSATEKTVTIKFSDNYGGDTFVIHLVPIKSTLDDDWFYINTDDKTYTGSVITTLVTSDLTEGTDYTVSYSANVNVGTATVTITGINAYTGTVTATFEIVQADQAAPTGLTATDETVSGKNDGSISGVTDNMEYYKVGSGTWQDIPVANLNGNKLTKLAPGTYVFRYKATTNYGASPDSAAVVINAGATLTVKFALNYTTDEAIDDVTGIVFGSKVTKPTDPTREGYVFEGWYQTKDGRGKWDFNNDTVSDNMTLYAKWTVKLASVGGMVQEYNNSDALIPAVGATVQLMKNGVQQGPDATTDVNGNYSFTNVPAGTYNIVVTKGGETVTALVDVKANTIAKTIIMPKGDRNSTVDNTAAGDFKAMVGGLDDVANYYELPNPNSDTVVIKLTVKEETPSTPIPVAEKTAIENKAKEEVAAGKTLEFVDLKLTKSVNGEAEVNYGEANTRLLQIIIPFDTFNKSKIAVYRYHGSAAQVLTTTPVDGEYIVVGTDTITIYAKKFSTYAIGYTEGGDSGSDGSSGSKPGSGFGSAYVPTAKPAEPVGYDKCPKDETCPIHPYKDASASAWYHDGVHYCIENGIMNGYSTTSFKPNGAVTRQQVWMTLARLSGEKPANSAEARAWAMANGVSDGTNPTKAVTRQQFITMLYRYAVDKGYDVSVGEETNILSYADAFSVSEYAIPAMQWGCGSGIMGGYSDGTLKPTSGATRAHLAAFLQRFCEGA